MQSFLAFIDIVSRPFAVVAMILPILLFYGWIVLFAAIAIKQLRPGGSQAKAAVLGAVALVPLL
jgi:hypothetical protein